MKKLTKILALSLALIMSVMMLASCSIFGAKPAKDFEDAKKALEDNDYDIGYADKNLDGDPEARIYASKKDEFITIYWYKDVADAKDAYKDAKEDLKKMKEDLKAMQDDLNEDDYKGYEEELDNYVIGRSGKMVWMASSKNAVKAAK